MIMVKVSGLILESQFRPESEIQRISTNLVRDLLQNGLIDPIKITTDNKVVDGICRVRAYKILGWRYIPAEEI